MFCCFVVLVGGGDGHKNVPKPLFLNGAVCPALINNTNNNNNNNNNEIHIYIYIYIYIFNMFHTWASELPCLAADGKKRKRLSNALVRAQKVQKE